MSHVQINGRRYTTSAGNTYHSVQVSVDGEIIGTAPYSYGYGDQYIVTAAQILNTDERFAGKLEGPVYLRYVLQDLGYTYGEDVVNVQRRKDLHNGGR